MKIKRISILIVMLTFIIVVFQVTSIAQFPERPITDVVYSSAGGGTDTWNRMICALMEEELGQKVNVSNMTGGSGGEAVVHVFNSAHNGYTWLGHSEGLCTHVVNGYHDIPTREWEFFVIAGSPGVVCVSADSPYETFNDLVAFGKENPNVLKWSTSGVGKLWHIKSFIATNLGAVKVEFVPYAGSRPAIVACLNGEADVVAVSVQEVADFIEAGQLRPIGMMENEDYDLPGFGIIPSVTKTFPEASKYYPLNQFLSFAVPADTPQNVIDKIDTAFKSAIKSSRIEDFAKEQYSTIYGLSGKEAKDMVLKMESVLSWFLADMGLAIKNPADFNIPKP